MGKIIAFDALRFIACLFIIWHHTGINIYEFHHIDHTFFRTAGLAVEIFFVLSGFLLAKSAQKALLSTTPGASACRAYFFGRIKRLWPEYIFAMLLCALLTNLFSHHISMRSFMLNAALLGGWGNIPNIINGIWYVVVLFWGGCLLFNLIVLTKEKAAYVILPVLSCVCLFYLINHGNTISGHQQSIEFNLLSKGTFRGLLGLTVGIYCFWICDFLKNIRVRFRPRITHICLAILEITAVVLLINAVLLCKGQDIADFNIYFYISFLVGLLYFKKERFLKFLSWNGWERVAPLSYTIYLTHLILLEILRVHWVGLSTMNPALMFTIVTLLCLAFGYLCYQTQKYLWRLIKKVLLIPVGDKVARP